MASYLKGRKVNCMHNIYTREKERWCDGDGGGQEGISQSEKKGSAW